MSTRRHTKRNPQKTGQLFIIGLTPRLSEAGQHNELYANGVFGNSPPADEFTRRSLPSGNTQRGRISGSQSLYVAHRGLSEHPAVLTIELANALVSHFKRGTRRV